MTRSLQVRVLPWVVFFRGNREVYFTKGSRFIPQLDYIGFHYCLNGISISYLLAYTLLTMYLLKPIFTEFFLYFSYRSRLAQDTMLFSFSYSERLLPTKPNKAVKQPASSTTG
jgi:hypothetical protein